MIEYKDIPAKERRRLTLAVLRDRKNKFLRRRSALAAAFGAFTGLTIGSLVAQSFQGHDLIFGILYVIFGAFFGTGLAVICTEAVSGPEIRREVEKLKEEADRSSNRGD